MDTSSYTIQALRSKYESFLAPSFEVTIGGKEITQISSLEVELNSGGSAGGCTFSIDAEYNHEAQKWENKLADVVKPGEKLTVKAGYVKKEEVFYGYIDEYITEMNQDGAPRITVNGIDGLAYLMSQQEPIYGGKKQAVEIIRSMLNKSVSAGFAKSVKVGSLKEFQAEIIKEKIDDWRFLNMLAQRYGTSLFAVDGELIFDSVLANSSPIVTLTLGQELSSFSRRVSMARQVGKVEIYGRDENHAPIKGTASSVSVGGSGKSAAEMVSAIKDSVLREYSEYVRTQEECELVAQNRLNGIAMGFVSGEGKCVGLPEMIPGRYVKIEGGADHLDGTYFISKVKHIFTTSSYETEFEVKGAKL